MLVGNPHNCIAAIALKRLAIQTTVAKNVKNGKFRSVHEVEIQSIKEELVEVFKRRNGLIVGLEADIELKKA